MLSTDSTSIQIQNMAVHVVFICSDAHKCFTQLTMKTKCELLFTGTRYIDMVCFHLSDDKKTHYT